MKTSYTNVATAAFTTVCIILPFFGWAGLLTALVIGTIAVPVINKISAEHDYR